MSAPDPLPEIDLDSIADATTAARRRQRNLGRTLRGQLPVVILGALIVLGVLAPIAYVLIGMVVVYKIDDDLAYEPPLPQGGSQAVAMAAGLLRREIRNGWEPNAVAWVEPGWYLDNMPNFQIGIRDSVRQFAIAMRRQIGRVRGSGADNPRLVEADERLSIDPRAFLLPASAENEYGLAAAAFEAYNQDVARGAAPFDPRGDNLAEFLALIRNDLGARSADSEAKILSVSELSIPPGQVSMLAAPRADFYYFYLTKGQVYAYYMILQGIEKDFGAVIDNTQVRATWNQMMASMRHAAELQPWMTLSGDPSGHFWPNHLAAQGFFLMRARVQLAEVMDVLRTN